MPPYPGMPHVPQDGVRTVSGWECQHCLVCAGHQARVRDCRVAHTQGWQKLGGGGLEEREQAYLPLSHGVARSLVPTPGQARHVSLLLQSRSLRFKLRGLTTYFRGRSQDSSGPALGENSSQRDLPVSAASSDARVPYSGVVCPEPPNPIPSSDPGKLCSSGFCRGPTTLSSIRLQAAPLPSGRFHSVPF